MLTVPGEIRPSALVSAAGAFGKPSMAATYMPALARRVRLVPPHLAENGQKLANDNM
jgi:hypothetical protein